MKITLDCKVSLAKNILIQELQGNSALVNLQTQEYFSQNEVATDMLWVLTESASIEVAYRLLLEEYEVNAQQLHQDLLGFIEQLSKYKIVEISESNKNHN
ncbi:PqqD family peptide modification chaperone [Scytonema sp. UIC 10036]|uniref:PqqD family protein n=1 Tax=Scytonema sp. UIC 10036 TaxID=2304196 RepID=UPI0012DACACC|nr:PqqD family protein [Scytonema sp. UIC 10036]MUG97512.1 PqqD family peptide modification chaperone [Scytonema sp. UIC 10036]